MLCLIVRRVVHGITYNLDLSPLHCGLRTLLCILLWMLILDRELGFEAIRANANECASPMALLELHLFKRVVSLLFDNPIH